MEQVDPQVQRLRMTIMLWETYEPKRFWWEFFECIRRLALTGMLVFIVPDSISQIAWALLMAGTAMWMLSFYCPYDDPLDDIVANSAAACLCMNLLAAMLIKTDVVGSDMYELPPEGKDGVSKAAFDSMLVFLNVLVILLAVAVVAYQACFAREDDDEEEDEGGAVDVDLVAAVEMSVMTTPADRRPSRMRDGSFSLENPVGGAVVERKGKTVNRAEL